MILVGHLILILTLIFIRIGFNFSLREKIPKKIPDLKFERTHGMIQAHVILLDSLLDILHVSNMIELFDGFHYHVANI